MDKCPICGKEVGQYHELTFKEPFVHNSPFDGLAIYGAYYAPKETICFENDFLHFAFYNSTGMLVDHRLVQLGVENPTTKSPSEEYMEGLEGDASDGEDLGDNEEEEDDPNDYSDAYDDEDHPRGSLDY